MTSENPKTTKKRVKKGYEKKMRKGINNPYSLYLKIRRDELKSSPNKKTNKEIMQLIAHEWKTKISLDKAYLEILTNQVIKKNEMELELKQNLGIEQKKYFCDKNGKVQFDHQGKI